MRDLAASWPWALHLSEHSLASGPRVPLNVHPLYAAYLPLPEYLLDVLGYIHFMSRPWTLRTPYIDIIEHAYSATTGPHYTLRGS